jgi:hypothetical protein
VSEREGKRPHVNPGCGCAFYHRQPPIPFLEVGKVWIKNKKYETV